MTDALLLAAGLVAALWVAGTLVSVALRDPRSARAAPAGMDLGPEPPAVAGLLCGDYEVRREVAAATLLDLAARDVVQLDEIQPGHTICRVPPSPPPGLAPYEQRVLGTLTSRAVDGVVPADALTTGTDAVSERWHRALARDVIADAQARGLTRDRWPARLVAIVGAGAVVALALLIAANELGDVPAEQAGATADAGVVVAVVGMIVIGWLAGRLGRSIAQLPTPAGREAESRWLGVRAHLRDNPRIDELPPASVRLYGRHLAYAAAFGEAHLAVELLPFAAEDDHRAWSSFGGRWRRVRVRYPRALPPGWGKHPAGATLLALLVGAAGAFVVRAAVDLDRSAIGQGGLLAVGALLLAWALWSLVRSVPDLFTGRVLTGTILRARVRPQVFKAGDDPKYWYYLAVDDGTADRIPALRVRREIYAQTAQGATVTVEISPRLRYVRSLQ